MLTACGKVAATRLSVLMLCASILRRQQETGSSHCQMSTYGDFACVQARARQLI